MKSRVNFVLSVVFVITCGVGSARGQVEGETDWLKVYEVNRKVSDFPDKEDFSTPEGAYVVINRVMASGEQEAWGRISIRRRPDRWLRPDTKRLYVPPERAKMWLNAKILEVRIFNQRTAVILADLSSDPESPEIDLRFVALEKGRWLNRGQDEAAGSLAEARAKSDLKLVKSMDEPVRPGIEVGMFIRGVLIVALIVLITAVVIVVISYGTRDKHQRKSIES